MAGPDQALTTLPRARPWRQADLPLISRLYFDTVHQVNRRDYSPAQLQAWAPAPWPEAWWRACFQARRVWVAERGGALAGFAEHLPGGHVDCFYVHPLHQGRGVGRALLETLAGHARRAGTGRLHAGVSLTARGFFVARGFRVVGHQERQLGEQRLRVHLMERLDGSPK